MTTSSRPIRVLEVIGALYFGGAEKVVTSLALGVDRSKFEMVVCCTRGFGPLAEPLEKAGIPVVLSTPATRVQRYLAPWYLWRVLRRFKPDIVHTHGLPGLVEVGPLAKLGLAPRWIHTYHFGNYPYANSRYMTVERLFSHAADDLVAVSEAQRQALIGHHGLRPDHIITLPNGVRDLPFLAEAAAVRTRKRAELGIAPDAPVIGSIAVLTEQKGMTYLLQAARQIVRDLPEARIVIVGDGPLKGPLAQEAEALGIGANVILTGWRADVGELLLSFDIWVMASLWEAMPLALLEAMAAGRPIVVTDVGDNRRIVCDGQAGRLVPPRDADALAREVLALWGNRPDAAALGQRARQRFEDRFTIARMVASYEALFAAGEDRRLVRQGLTTY